MTKQSSRSQEIQGVIIATHMPPSDFFETTQKLSTQPNVRIYVIDSSAGTVSLRVREHIRKVNQAKENQSQVYYRKTSNYGVGYTYNFGIKKAIDDGCTLLILFTDDIRIPETLPLKNIHEFFYSKCNPKIDALFLPQNPIDLVQEMNQAPDSGMMFSKELFKTVQFREEFVLDQIDFEFSKSIHQHGGKIFVYPHITLGILPIGRELKHGERILPPWRLYLLTRNSVTMSLESRDKIGSLKNHSLLQITQWGLAGLRSGQSRLLLFKAVLFGCIDALTKNLGVTVFLENLSNNRFNKKPT